MKSDRIVEEIKERIDIVDFISGFVQLRKSGQNWKGLCPFHAEKTPSFMVSPSKQIYHCFGCGNGGDVISFLVNYEKMSFPEAVKELAGKAGIAVEMLRHDKKAVEKGEQIRSALREASAFYVQKLAESATAREYLRNRGLSGGSIELFRLGYAPAGWGNLVRHLRQAGFSESSLLDAGLAVSGQKGIYDMFRERIIFPIMAANGSIIAFGARAMDNTMPKYINSPETEVFRKSESLYGLFDAREALRSTDHVIVVEGYMDVIVCHQYGIKNVVAPLGTSLTNGHLQRLRKLVKEVLLVFDGDAAGIAAAKRSLLLLARNDLHARVLILPDSEDPDSYLRKHGAEAFGILLKKARTAVDFILNYTGGQKSQIVRDALSVIAARTDQLEAEQMLMELAGKTRISEAVLRAEYRKLVAGETGVRGMPAAQPVMSKSRKEEELLLSAVIAFPEKADAVLGRISPDDIRDKTVSSLFRMITVQGISGLPDHAGEEERLLFTKLSVSPGFDPEFVDRNIEDCIAKIEGRKLEERLQNARETDDVALINALLIEKNKIIKGKGHEKR